MPTVIWGLTVRRGSVDTGGRQDASVDVAELVLEYIKVLAWPIVVSGLLIAFRNQIGGKIASLSRVRTPIGDADFDRDARDVEELADRAAAHQDLHGQSSDGVPEGGTTEDALIAGVDASERGEASDDSSKSADGGDSPAAEGPTALRERQMAALLLAINAIGSPPDFDIARNVAVQSPSASIMLAYSELEKVARAAMTISEVERPQARRNLTSIVNSLTQSGLSVEFVQVARELAHLRNRVAHGSGDQVSTAGALDFIAACERLAEALIANATSKLRHPSRSEILRELQALIKAWRSDGTHETGPHPDD